MERNLAIWAVTMTAACILAGCGGEDHPSTTAAAPQTPALRPSVLRTGGTLTLAMHAQGRQQNAAAYAGDPHIAVGSDESPPEATGADFAADETPCVDPIQRIPDIRDIPDIADISEISDIADISDISDTRDGNDASQQALALGPAVPADDTIANVNEIYQNAWKKRRENPINAVFADPMINDQGLVNATLKFLISSSGPEQLLQQLHDFTQNPTDTDKNAAATKFSALVAATYDGENQSKQDMQGFFGSLLAFKSFADVNQTSLSKFLTSIDALPSLFDMFNDAFHLNTASLDGAHDQEKSASYYTVDRDRLLEDQQGLPSIVKQLVSDEVGKTSSSTASLHGNEVESFSMAPVADLEKFKRLTVKMAGQNTQKNSGFNKTIEFPALDPKSGQEVLLRLMATEMVFYSDEGFFTLIKDKDTWMKHGSGHGRRAIRQDFQQDLLMVNFTPIGAQLRN